jgi:hypothetical protein
MSTIERPARPALTLTLLFLLCALACFGLGLLVAEDWLTKGTVWEWAFGGFIFSTLAKIL